MRLISKAFALALAIVPLCAFAQTDDVAPTIDPLSLYVRTTYPHNMTTVAEAAQYILEPTGYRLTTSRVASRTAARLAAQPIPPIARLNRTMPIIDALQLLIGLNHWVIVDTQHKLVTFQETAP